MTSTTSTASDAASFQPGGKRRVFISLFLLFHLFVILVWAFPANPAPIRFARFLVGPYMNWSGLFQNWNLFAPDPQSVNAYLDAEITCRNGEKKIWKFPMPQDYGYYRRYFLSRQLKWSADNLRQDRLSPLWPDAARYIARRNNDPANPPVAVKLMRHWAQVPPPMSGEPETWNTYTFFRYSVAPGDLW